MSAFQVTFVVLGRWYQFSLTSWGIGCYKTGTPDVQNMVFPYLEWIEEVTGTHQRVTLLIYTKDSPHHGNGSLFKTF